MTFDDARNEYEQQRERERVALAKFLPTSKEMPDVLRVVSGRRAGKGWCRYTSGGRIKAYNLSNWKWVEVTDDSDFTCIVSLNMPDVDPRSGNPHFLMDRVGLLVSYHKDGCYYETAIYPDIDLPLDNAKMERIAQLVRDQFEIYRQQKEA